MRNKKFFNKKSKEKEEKLNQEIDENGGLEKKDMLAMVLSAFLTIFPICTLIIIGLGLLVLWLFKAL